MCLWADTVDGVRRMCAKISINISGTLKMHPINYICPMDMSCLPVALSRGPPLSCGWLWQCQVMVYGADHWVECAQHPLVCYSGWPWVFLQLSCSNVLEWHRAELLYRIVARCVNSDATITLDILESPSPQPHSFNSFTQVPTALDATPQAYTYHINTFQDISNHFSARFWAFSLYIMPKSWSHCKVDGTTHAGTRFRLWFFVSTCRNSASAQPQLPLGD